jgi:uncharacterized protein (DUF433 family)
MSDDSVLVAAARALLQEQSAPVELGRLYDRERYVLVPAACLERLGDAMTPEQRAPRPFVSISPEMKGGSAVLHGTRLTAQMIAERYWWHGGTALQAEVLDAYEITRADVAVCCFWMSVSGSRTWRKRWADWLEATWKMTRFDDGSGRSTGWWGDWETLDLPPTREAAP